MVEYDVTYEVLDSVTTEVLADGDGGRGTMVSVLGAAGAAVDEVLSGQLGCSGGHA